MQDFFGRARISHKWPRPSACWFCPADKIEDAVEAVADAVVDTAKDAVGKRARVTRQSARMLESMLSAGIGAAACLHAYQQCDHTHHLGA